MSDAVNAHVRTVLFGAAHVERGRFVWKMPLRASIVVTLLVTWIAFADKPALAVPVAIGALFSAVADVGEPVGYRWRIMLWTTSWLMVATFIGQLVASSVVAVLVASAAMAFTCGLIGALGSRAALASLLSLVVFTIYAGSPALASDATPDVLLMGLGGVVQTAVTVIPTLVFHPSRARRPTRDPFLLSGLPPHLTITDPFFRHGIRLAVALTAATALAAAIDEPHTYWIPMSVAWMAKPDRDGTSTRILGRLAGTAAGLLSVAVIMGIFHESQASAIGVVAGGSFLALAFIWANYAIAVVGITAFVIALFSINGGPVADTLLLRMLDTVIAAVITFAATFLLPVRPQAPASTATSG